MGIYKPEFDQQAYKLCLLNATNKELANFFEVSERTIEKWCGDNETFRDAIRAGKMVADSNVAARLYDRATGSKVTKQKVLNNGDIVDYVEEVPPDTKAAEFWLINRTRNSENPWTNKQQLEVSDNEGNPLKFILGDVAESAEDASPLPNGD
ncbi:hypothetical protein [Photobacterium halotolerans]|uniref:hypothetical protein n=1 Tax=Photobacterium halotolerans TaxID=265726 RepID=UPI0004273B72|nr:hypothetical protein [Photobacterium halotolerans]